MRHLLPYLFSFLLLVSFDCNARQKVIRVKTPPRPAGQSDVLKLRCEPISTVRVGFIGIGSRGLAAVHRFLSIPGVEIKALCDLESENLDKARALLVHAKFPAAQEYSSKNGYKEICERQDIDLIYICTDWLNHTPIAVYAMEHGKHTAIEVPAAVTLEQCWELVNTAEKTRRHCMMLENCCYDRFEMATLNMAQKGLFGEIVHVEGAYIHNLRDMNINEKLSAKGTHQSGVSKAKKEENGLVEYWRKWRMAYNIEHSGNPYPTHGLGPVCQVLNIHRGDKMNYLVSVSSGQFGLTDYAKEHYGEDSPQSDQPYKLGDMNTSIIKTEKGKTIMIQHDITSPRPYSRMYQIVGADGYASKYPIEEYCLRPSQVDSNDVPNHENLNAHGSVPADVKKALMDKYKHPIHKELEETAKKVGGHGGMDFIMDYRLAYCLQNGLPLDMDVYDLAEWCCMAELTRLSIENNSAPVEIPDFTRGGWNKVQGYHHAFVK